MNTLSLPVEDEGPMVDILVGLAAPEVLALRQAGRPVPAPVPARALLDTGASMSSVDPHVLQPLIAAANLPPSRFLFANLPMSGGLNFVSEYAVGLTVVHPSGDPQRNLVLRNWAVLEQSLGPLGYQALLGRDVLARCVFFYDGRSSSFTLAY